MASNVCQYWSVDKDGEPTEPSKCAHWDAVGAVCNYSPSVADDPVVAPFAPFCNLIGTEAKCSTYKSTGSNQSRCILPDFNRHVVRRSTGKKWVEPPTIGEDGTYGDIDFSGITEYNDGQCDGAGTAAKCTGYAPYILQFGIMEPAASDELHIDEMGFTTVSGFDVRLPIGYEIYNKRAEMSRCYWWKADSVDFEVVSSSGVDRGKLQLSAPSACTNNDEIVATYTTTFKFDTELNMYRAPCNGCKPECPGYTSVCWEYCVDSEMRHGDKVRTEQILEFRYNIKKSAWSAEEYDKSFGEDSDLYAWGAPIKYVANAKGDLSYIIPSIRTYISDFEYFTIGYSNIPLTQGTPADDKAKNYPSMVRQIKNLTLAPIIMSKFETVKEDVGGVSTDTNVFETSKLNHKYITIVGNHFYYNAAVYAINLSDPELNFLPKDLYFYKNMSDIKAKLSADAFNEFYSNLDCMLSYVLNDMPEKMPVSSFGADTDGFYINVPTFFGNNDIFVLTKGSGRWEFDKISVKKIFCGGVVGQLSFSVEGDGKEVPYLPSYEDSFKADVNNNGRIDIGFFPMSSISRGEITASASLDYFYNDFAREQLSANPLTPETAFELGYKLYKITAYENLEIEMKDVRFFGNAGYALVTIPDDLCRMHHVFRPWDVEGLKLQYPSDSKTIDMVVYSKCTDYMDSHQFVIRPKDVKEFSSVCRESKVLIGKIYTYEKKSFNDVPSPLSGLRSEVILDTFLEEDTDVIYKLNERITSSGDTHRITKFANNPLNIAAVFKGFTGRKKGQFKTKLITWVRQPFCRDVEIYYSWSAGYKKYMLLPDHRAYDPIGVKPYPGLAYAGYVPPCGDHDLSRINNRYGSMWYPYTDCDSYARYDMTRFDGFDIRIMEVFWEGWSDPPHGQHDIRMMGPADNFGWVCDTHAHLWNCWLDWSFCNMEKQTKNMWKGASRYRGGMTYLDQLRCVEGGGKLPQFGNVYRDFMKSDRSVDTVYYYYFDGSMYRSMLKWVAATESYSKSNFTLSSIDTPYRLYNSNDYYDDGSLYMDQMGLLLAANDIEGVDIGERIDPSRYMFNEVFKPHYSLSGLYYPYPRHPYQVAAGGGALVDVISWYTYKDVPGGDRTKSIQWAWQEPWQDIDRYVITGGDIDCSREGAISFKYIHPTIKTFPENVVAEPYSNVGGFVQGKHTFLLIDYPPYMYDYTIKEHGLVCDEGVQTVRVAPVKDEDTGKVDHWFVQLNEGPSRCFDFDGNWVDDDECNNDLYSTCTQEPWVNTVTLFDTGYDSVTPDPDRTIRTYDAVGESVDTYFQRGLNVSIDTTKFGFLPKKLNLLDPYGDPFYEVKLSKIPALTPEMSDNEWANIEDLSQWYPGTNAFSLMYNQSDSSVEISFKISKEIVMGAVAIDYTIGSEGEMVEAGKKSSWYGSLYNIPAIQVSKSSDDTTYTPIYTFDSMYLSTKDSQLEPIRCFYKFTNVIADEFYQYIKISLRLVPTAAEVSNFKDLYSYFYNDWVNKFIKLESIYLYSYEYIEAQETIETHERKYRISSGSHGDFPPHGYDDTGSLLYVLPNDRSTVQQMDSHEGVVGMGNSGGDCKTMNKCRGRIMKSAHMDKEPVSGPIDVYSWEAEQKKIHDEIAINSGSPTFVMTSTMPPGIEDYLEKAGLIFPSWICVFTNSLVSPLAPIKAYGSYSPTGHLNTWDLTNMRREYLCGVLFVRFAADIIDYILVHQGTGDEVLGALDPLVAYSRGIAGVMINPLAFHGGASLNDALEAHYRSTGSNITELSLQGSVSPLY